MNHSILQFEDKFFVGLDEVSLPSTFNLIYQEGIRGNHILFHAEDVKRFESIPLDSRCLKTSLNKDNVEELFYKLIMSGDYREMHNMINACEFSIKRQIFLLYQRFLNVWSAYLRKSLN